VLYAPASTAARCNVKGLVYLLLLPRLLVWGYGALGLPAWLYCLLAAVVAAVVADWIQPTDLPP
jgi:hypothetical protein